VSILGNRVLRKEDPKFLTSGGTYVDDVRIEGAAALCYVRSPFAHARIEETDTDEARRAPGVIDVVTAADLDVGPLPPEVPGMLNERMARPLLADGVVRFVGEAVVAVVAETREQAVDAAEMVFVAYEPLPTVLDPEQAEGSRTLLHPPAGTNVSAELAFGRDDSLFEGCEIVVRQRIVNQRVAPCPLEVRAAASRWDGDELTHWSSSQSAHTARDVIARGLGVDPGKVRVKTPDVGGGFGAKMYATSDEVLVAWLARRIGRPLRWVETRSESMVAFGHGRAQVQHVEIGGSADGRILAYRLEVVQDSGAYPSMGALLPFMTRTMASGTYDIPKVEFNSRSVVTNTTPVLAYRGAGRPEATAAIERAVDIFASEAGLDPAEVRRRNLIRKEAFPYTTPTGATYDVGDYERALDLLLDTAGYSGLRAEQRRRRESGDVRQLGIGLSVYVEITNGVPLGEYASVEVRADGKALVKTGTSPHGQGHATAWAMLASDATGIPIEDIEVVHGDTALVPRGAGTMASRSLQVGGVAVAQASEVLVDKAREVAAELLEASVEDVELDKSAGSFHVAGAPSVARSWGEVAAAAGRGGGLSAEVDFRPDGPTFPFGAHLAVVEVDTETGKVELSRLVAVDDAGTVLNPLLAEGQIHGGLAQGAAQALLEEVRYDGEGNPVTANLADYEFVSAAELPGFETVRMETPTPMNSLGAKGIGESATIGSTPAVQNAVVDALSHLGVRHIDMPATPERVWRTLQGAADRVGER
jgi:carbon-monoxide dehydrogenase large subunit